MSKFIVQVAGDRMPKAFRTKYYKIAILEVHDHVNVATMISERSKDVVRIVDIWRRVRGGKAEADVMEEATRKCEDYNFVGAAMLEEFRLAEEDQ